MTKLDAFIAKYGTNMFHLLVVHYLSGQSSGPDVKQVILEASEELKAALEEYEATK